MRFKVWFSGYAEFDAVSYEHACEMASDQLSLLGSPTLSLEPGSATVSYDACQFEIHDPSWRIGACRVEGEHLLAQRQELNPTKSCPRCGFTVPVAPPEPLPTRSESDEGEGMTD